MTNYHGIIGLSREDITPPVGIFARNWGAATHDVAAGVHMPLTLTCITFQTDKNVQPLVLVSADLGWWKSAADEKTLRQGILQALSLPEERLMFCLTHTHAGPSTFSEDAGKPGGQYIIPYLQQLQEKAVSCIRRALADAQPATLTWQYGSCNLAVNRDFPEPGGDRLVVGYNPAVSADDTVLVGRITDNAGKVTGTIVNYACHPTTLAWENQLLSPDYIGGMRTVVEAATAAPCLFLQGASGELSPAEQYSGDTSLADGYGRQLGYAVLSVLEGMLPPDTTLTFTGVVESGASLGIWKKTPAPATTTLLAEMTLVEMPLKPMPSLAEIEAAWATCEHHVIKERLWRQRGIRKTVGEGTVAKMPLWIWRLGNTILAGQPNEAYSLLQQELRQQLAPATVAVMNIVNGYAGYLPPSASFSHHSYTVWQTPFQQGSLEQLIHTAITISQRMIQSA
ncbi:neutral/alkaline non-lysosomal ceramidase N-terminal domain-containing protein [Chitinophaga flava]|uniref:Neutral/alkaline non-lysosomal ceramidase N-terminal domain-containing protein n=1 Tax=Chitinophaga flava TaxID=2259036 RepID=A0A365XYQ8_9BACT|nr:neutral/alkaline non-lysosomal ceramidase N-terminal domain-containing protein [Chitinophaga flava]RBL91473.1 hypothetical protein DF182_02330 [Chitinophaga flava]